MVYVCLPTPFIFLLTLGWVTVVEFDLRSDKMMHGSKALERVVWSFTEVLTGPVAFLFCDLYQRGSFRNLVTTLLAF